MSKKGKKGKKKIAGLMLFLGWMIFILLAVVFYFYFFSDLDLRMFNKDKATQTDAQQTNQTGFSYETNANLDINSLIIEYYAALAVCDQDKLKTYVTDPSQFDDMTVYQQRSAVQGIFKCELLHDAGIHGRCDTCVCNKQLEYGEHYKCSSEY